jgi:hypothetical protein
MIIKLFPLPSVCSQAFCALFLLLSLSLYYFGEFLVDLILLTLLPLGITVGQQNLLGRRVWVGQVWDRVRLQQPMENPYLWCGFRWVDGLMGFLLVDPPPGTSHCSASGVLNLFFFFAMKHFPISIPDWALLSARSLPLHHAICANQCDNAIQFKTATRPTRTSLSSPSFIYPFLYW